MVGDVVERLVEILRPEGLSDDERMQRQCHHPAAVGGVVVQLIQLVLDDLHEVGTAQALAKEESNVVELHRIWDVQQAGHRQRIRLVVVRPVQYISNAQFGEQLGGLKRLGQRGAEPSPWSPARRLLDGGDHVGEISAFGAARDVGLQCRVVLAMRQPRPIARLSGLDDVRIVLRDIGIEQHAGPYPVPIEDLDQPPDADTWPVVAPAEVQRVGHQVCGVGVEVGGRAVDLEVFDVQPDIERDARTVGPLQRRPLDNGAVREELVVHTLMLKPSHRCEGQPAVL